MINFDGISNEHLFVAMKQTRDLIMIERGRYYELVKEATKRKIPNTKISRELGVSEAAIRNYKKRKGL